MQTALSVCTEKYPCADLPPLHGAGLHHLGPLQALPLERSRNICGVSSQLLRLCCVCSDSPERSAALLSLGNPDSGQPKMDSIMSQTTLLQLWDDII